jgi:hypothetical protein
MVETSDPIRDLRRRQKSVGVLTIDQVVGLIAEGVTDAIRIERARYEAKLQHMQRQLNLLLMNDKHRTNRERRMEAEDDGAD